LCVNCIIIICTNVNAVINNNYERLQDLILFLRIPKDTRKDLFEIYGQFGHAPSKRFASPGMCCLGWEFPCVADKLCYGFRPRETRCEVGPGSRTLWICFYNFTVASDVKFFYL
jgi:hypothetical protein